MRAGGVTAAVAVFGAMALATPVRAAEPPETDEETACAPACHPGEVCFRGVCMVPAPPAGQAAPPAPAPGYPTRRRRLRRLPTDTRRHPTATPPPTAIRRPLMPTAAASPEPHRVSRDPIRRPQLVLGRRRQRHRHRPPHRRHPGRPRERTSLGQRRADCRRAQLRHPSRRHGLGVHQRAGLQPAVSRDHAVGRTGRRTQVRVLVPLGPRCRTALPTWTSRDTAGHWG